MPVRNLDKIFRPHSIAVVGASDDLTKVGSTVLRNLLGGGFQGTVYPVNSKRASVQGVAAYPSIAALPHPVDLAVLCTPAPTIPDLVRQCGEAGTRGVLVISAGFREIGPDGRNLEDRVRAVAAGFEGLRILGPNCLGIISPHIGLNASFAGAMPPAGQVAFVSQSGALCTAVLDWALDQGIGFSHFISVGNMLDVSMGDLIDFLAADPLTHSLILYIESITDAREFMSAARAFARKKPIVAYKAGRFAESAQAAASHTGALAGVDAVYEAALARAGIVRILEVDDMFDCAELLARHKTPPGANLGIVTNAGGPGVMATDALIARRGQLAKLSPPTIARLNEQLPPFWSHGNPVDVLGDAPAQRYVQAIEALAVDPGVDAILVILTPQAMTQPLLTAEGVAGLAARLQKPLLASWMGGAVVQGGVQVLDRADVPTYATPEHAVRAFMHLVDYARRRELLYETPREVPLAIKPDRQQVRQMFRDCAASGLEIMPEHESKLLLATYGIPVTRPEAAGDVNAAVETARRTGYPVALKILSPQITHKTDVGGVELNLKTDDEVRAAWERMMATVHQRRPDAQVDGVTVQRMVVTGGGFELIVGAKKDPVFGSVMLAGAGGIAAEVFQDRALELPPLNERLALRMLQSLRSWPLLAGYRGRPGVDVDILVATLIRVSYLVADCPEILELDINPLLVKGSEIVALDARVVIDRSVVDGSPAPYSHLAIRPYPEEYSRGVQLPDGTALLLRPIKPEDEPLWHAMLDNCSQQSIFFRFRSLFKHDTHESAARYCFIDYDREMAIVAEWHDECRREIVGVGRLVADPDHQVAEYAVLVPDAWQGRGLGSMLTSYCLEIARRWQLKRVYGETTADNPRMLATFRKWGFDLDYKAEPDVVVARKVL